MSLKNGDDVASTDLWTRKLTWSDDWRMTSAWNIFEYFGGEAASRVGPSEHVISIGNVKSNSACGGVQVLSATQLHG